MKLRNYLSTLSEDIRIDGLASFLKGLLVKESVSFKKLAKRCRTPYRSLMNYLEDTRSIPLSVVRHILQAVSEDKEQFEKLLDSVFNQEIRFKSLCSHSRLVHLPKEISEDLAYLIGAMHDGCVYADHETNQYLVQYVQHSNKQWLIVLSEMFIRTFSIRPQMYKGYLQVSSKPVYEFFSRVVGVPQYQKDWSSFLIDRPWNLQQRYIAGMFDAEGWCGGKDDLRLKFSQKNENKLQEIKDALEEHNIHCGRVVSENNAHALYVCGKNALKFANTFAPLSLHPHRKQKLSLISKVV